MFLCGVHTLDGTSIIFNTAETAFSKSSLVILSFTFKREEEKGVFGVPNGEL